MVGLELDGRHLLAVLDEDDFVPTVKTPVVGSSESTSAGYLLTTTGTKREAQYEYTNIIFVEFEFVLCCRHFCSIDWNCGPIINGWPSLQ